MEVVTIKNYLHVTKELQYSARHSRRLVNQEQVQRCNIFLCYSTVHTTVPAQLASAAQSGAALDCFLHIRIIQTWKRVWYEITHKYDVDQKLPGIQFWKGCKRSTQCNVEFGYKLSTSSKTGENEQGLQARTSNIYPSFRQTILAQQTPSRTLKTVTYEN